MSKITKLFMVLFLFAATLVAQPYATVYVDATNGSDTYSGENEFNLPAMSGPKATFAAAKAIVAEGGTIVIKAGTYTEALDLSTGLAAGPTPASVVNYTIQLKQLNANTDVVFTGVSVGDHAVINKANLTVNIVQFGTTEKIVLNPAAAADAVISLVAGTIQMASDAIWSVSLNTGGVQDEVDFNMTAGKFQAAAPKVNGVAATTGINLNYLGADNYTAGQEAAYASYGGIGVITINKAAAGEVVTFPTAIAFNAANILNVITATQGGATFPSTINLGLGDIVNNGGGTITVTGLVSAGVSIAAGILDANLSSVINAANGSIKLDGGITWTTGDMAAAKDFTLTPEPAVDNQGAGTISTGPVNLVTFGGTGAAADDIFEFSFDNLGTLNVGLVTAAAVGAGTPAPSYAILHLNNFGTASIAGGRYRGDFTNTGGAVTVTGATVVDGLLTNNASGTLALGANTFELKTSQAHNTNGGTITATEGGLFVTTTAAVNSFNGGTLSNVTIDGAGGTTTFQTNNTVITTLKVNAGTAVVNFGVTTTTTNVTGGTLTVNNGTTLTTTDLFESAGTINLGSGASGVIDVKRDFSRTGGIFIALAGSLMQFSGTVAQNVDGGPLFQLVNLNFQNSVSPITVHNTIRTSGTATISTATTINFGTYNLVANSATAKVVNNGTYNITEGSGGGVILGGSNLVPLGFAGGGQTIEGTGIFTYITVDVTNTLAAPIPTTGAGVAGTPTTITSAAHGFTAADNGTVIYYAGCANLPAGYYGITYATANTFTVNVTTVGNPVTGTNYYVVPTAKVVDPTTGVKFSGVLRLYTGALSVSKASVDFSPYGSNAKIIRHVYDDVAPLSLTQPVLVADVGTWNAAAVQYNLEYATGTALATTAVDVLIGSREFPAATNLVKNLTVSADGPFAVQVTANRAFVGNLQVDAGSVLGVTGSLTSSSLTGTHVVSGDVTQNAANVANKLVFTGGGTVTGGTGNSNIVAVDFNTTGTYTVSAMKLLGANFASNTVSVLGGATVNLSVANVGVAATDWGDVTNLTVTNGRVNLMGDIDIVNRDMTVGASGIFDFMNNNIWWKSAGSFLGNAASKYYATGASTGGYLQIRATSGINTNGALVPRIIFDPAVPAAGTFTLTMSGNTGVSDILTNTGDDILEIATFTFNHAGNIWNHGGTATYPSTAGNGIFKVTGPVTANLGANAALPNLTVDNGTNVFTLVDNIAGAGVPTITVTDPAAAPGVFIMTAGNVELGACDIAMTDAGTAFTYTAGVINGTSNVGLTVTDAQNGELVFNHSGAAAQAISLTNTFTVPNVRVVGTIGQNFNMALANGKNLVVTKRFVFGEGHAINLHPAAANGYLEFGDGCFVERRAIAPTWAAGPVWNVNYAALVQDPVWPTGGVIDLFHNVPNTATGPAAQVVPAVVPTYTVAKEMPAATTTTLRNWYISMGANTHTDNTGAAIVTVQQSILNGAKNVLVGNELHLVAGFYQPEVGANQYTVTMAENGHVIRYDGTLIDYAGTPLFTLLGGPVDLTYKNAGALLTTTQEYPTTMVVKKLTANGNAVLRLHDSRSCGDFELITGTVGSPLPVNIKFDLNGKTLSVTADSSAVLTRGWLTSEAVTAGVYQFANLVVTGPVSSTASTTVTNVNISTPVDMNLAGDFTTDDVDGVGGSVVVGLPTATVVGDFTTSALFNGNLIVDGNVTVATGGQFSAASNITFQGPDNVTITVPTGGVQVGGMVLNKDYPGYKYISLVGGNLTCNGTVDFRHGVFITGEKTLRLANPAGTMNQGYTRDNLIGLSHVIGNVAKQPKVGTIKPWSRSEFPVGDSVHYRPATISITDVVDVNLGAWVTVSEVSHAPTGTLGLPVEHNDRQYSRFPDFYWYIRSTQSLGQIIFDLELTAGGFQLYQSVDDVVLLRRTGTINDANNPWILQGTQYDNNTVEEDSIVTIININSLGGILPQGGIFTYGIPTRLWYAGQLEDMEIGIGEQNRELVEFADFFQGASGDFQYSAQSANSNIVRVPEDEFSDPQFYVVGVQNGTAVVIVKARDDANDDFVTAELTVTVDGTVDTEIEEIPTEFSLAQNYPNPFNPTTKIKFGLPEAANVSLRVYNILGEEVATLVNSELAAGFHTINFNATNLTSGLYIYRIEAGSFVEVRKMMLMK